MSALTRVCARGGVGSMLRRQESSGSPSARSLLLRHHLGRPVCSFSLSSWSESIVDLLTPKRLTGTIVSDPTVLAVEDVGSSVSHALSSATTQYAELVASLEHSFILPPELSAWHIAHLQNILHWFHESLGLSWWLSIVAMTFAFRTLVLPLNLSLVRNSARLNAIRPELETLRYQLQQAGPGEAEQRYAISKEICDMFKRYKCNPFKNIVSPILMTPMFLSVFMSIERMIVFTPSCREGGALWFADLTATDVTWLLPVISAMTWIGTVKAGADRIRTPMARYFENFLSYLSLAMIPVTSSLPQGVFLYWISSNTFSLIQMFALRNAKIRAFLRIPPSVSPNPTNE